MSRLEGLHLTYKESIGTYKESIGTYKESIGTYRAGQVLSHKSDWPTPARGGLAKTHLLGSAVQFMSIYYATGGASE